MKKLYIALLTLMSVLILSGCSQSEFRVDGKFTAYEVSIHSNAPQLTYVTVTVEDGEVTEYHIDVRQGYVLTTEGDTTEYSFHWNEMTKKELEFAYGMKDYGTGYDLIDGAWVLNEDSPEFEWHEQAYLIEQHLLEFGLETVETIEGRFSNIAGVTINESGLLLLVEEALALAKAGKFHALLCTADDLYIASMVVNDSGEISDLTLDVLQGDPEGDTFAWNEFTKQELADEYGMKGIGAAYEFSNGSWVASDEKTSLEWYEQANLITDYIETYGWDDNIQALADRGATIDGTTLIDDLAGVTIRSQTFYDVLTVLFQCVG
ncbi:MAG: hypothetical protein JXB08_04420 [Bacilli bacterium]|nr:hypothetical protein [Bacilli bacterium]MBN2876361.1 hypothetical protein [Bacilli bacterium]